jgi:hypothetical protein
MTLPNSDAVELLMAVAKRERVVFGISAIEAFSAVWQALPEVESRESIAKSVERLWTELDQAPMIAQQLLEDFVTLPEMTDPYPETHREKYASAVVLSICRSLNFLSELDNVEKARWMIDGWTHLAGELDAWVPKCNRAASGQKQTRAVRERSTANFLETQEQARQQVLLNQLGRDSLTDIITAIRQPPTSSALLQAVTAILSPRH